MGFFLKFQQSNLIQWITSMKPLLPGIMGNEVLFLLFTAASFSQQ